jgi:hypothetical protein
MADRMHLFAGVYTSASGSALSPTGLAGFPYASRIQRTGGTSGTSEIVYSQSIETANCQDLAGGNVTVSFYARRGSNYSAASNVLNVLLSTGTGTDEGVSAYLNTQFLGSFMYTGLSTVTQQASLSTSWAKYTFTYYVSSNVNEIVLAFNSPRTGVAGGNDYFDITGIQLEAGSSATEFERRPIGTELALCQRYFEKSVAQGVSITAAGYGSLIATVPSASIANGVYYYNTKFAVTKRVAPQIFTYPYTTPSNVTALSTSAGVDLPANSGQVSIFNETMFAVNNGSGATITTGADLRIMGNWYASAEI